MKSVAAVGTVHFLSSSIAESWDEAEHLLYAHHAEVGILEQSRFRPNREMRQNLEKAGVLEVYVMRDEDRRLQGYAVFTVHPHPDYEGSLWARQDALYVHPAWRGKSAAEFMRWQFARLREKYAGVEIVCYSTPRKPFGSLLELMGFREMEVAYILGREEARLA